MKFVCERCHTKYSIADEKVRGKVLKVRCKTCTNVITVRETGASVDDAPAGGAALPGPAPAATHAGAKDPPHGSANVAPAATIVMPSPVATSASNGASSRSVGASRPNNTVSSLAATAVAPSPRRMPAPLQPLPPPPPPPASSDDVEWYMAVDGGQTGPFGRKVLLEKVLSQTKDADVHVWNADLDGWKVPKDLPELAHELSRRRRSQTPVPPPPPRKVFPTAPSPAAGTAVSAPLALAKAPGAPGAAAHSLSSAQAVGPMPGTRSTHETVPHREGPSAKKKNGAAPGFVLDHLVGGDASTAAFANGRSSAAALPALIAPTASAPVVMATASTSAADVSVPIDSGAWASTKNRRPTKLLFGGLGVALALCAIVAFAVLRPSSSGAPATTVVAADPPKPSGTDLAAMAEALARQQAEAELARSAKEAPAGSLATSPGGESSSSKTQGAIAHAPDPTAAKPGRRNKRNSKGHPTATTPPPMAPGAAVPDLREAALSGRLPESSGRELRVPTAGAVGARSTPVQADISRVINNNRQGIQTCYQRALLRDNSLTNGKITVRVTVGLSGRVQRVNLDASAPFRALEPCIRDVMSRWAFPPSSEEYQTEFPVVLAGNQ